MSKKFVMVLAAALALSLAILSGCGGEQPSSEASAPSSSSVPLSSSQEPEESSQPDEASEAEASSSSEAASPEGASVSESASQAASQSGEPQEPVQESQLVYNDGAVFGGPEEVLGTQEELDAWTAAAADMSGVSRIVASTFSDPRALTAEEVQGVLDTLQGLTPQLMESKGNPSTGGVNHIIAYDAAGNRLWQVTVTGDWFLVRLAGDDTPRLFSIEGQDVSAIFNLG